jgi:hypothetical protein
MRVFSAITTRIPLALIPSIEHTLTRFSSLSLVRADRHLLE